MALATDDAVNNDLDTPDPETLRGALESAFDEHEGASTGEDTEAAPPRVSTEGRDALGRFAPKRTDAAPAQPELDRDGTATPPTQDAALKPEAPEATQFAQAPASWKPEEKAHWEKLPTEARATIMRREVEINRAMQESVEARRGVDAMRGVVGPYMANIQAANGGDVVGAMKTFFDYDNRLRHGTQIEKARAVTALIKGYGVDINALDTELAGAQHSPQQQQQTELQAALQRELAPFRSYLSQQQQAQATAQAAAVADVESGLAQFGAAHPHYEAVRNTMADIIDIASAQGRQVTVAEAYEAACWQTPQIRAMMIKEQAGPAAKTQAAQRARAAAVGVRTAPRAGGGAPNEAKGAGARDDRGADIRAAIDEMEGRE